MINSRVKFKGNSRVDFAKLTKRLVLRPLDDDLGIADVQESEGGGGEECHIDRMFLENPARGNQLAREIHDHKHNRILE